MSASANTGAVIDRLGVRWQEDGSATCLARVTARDGSGAATGISGEGNWIKQADLSTITCKVFDLSSSTPDTAIATPTVTISSAIQDTPVTSNTIWTVDTVGYNFLFDLSSTNFPTGDHEYLVEFYFTAVSGAKWTVGFVGPAAPVQGS